MCFYLGLEIELLVEKYYALSAGATDGIVPAVAFVDGFCVHLFKVFAFEP
jgi:hypothetical protein